MWSRRRGLLLPAPSQGLWYLPRKGRPLVFPILPVAEGKLQVSVSKWSRAPLLRVVPALRRETLLSPGAAVQQAENTCRSALTERRFSAEDTNLEEEKL